MKIQEVLNNDVQEAKNSPEFKELVTKYNMTYISTPRQEANGTLSFLSKDKIYTYYIQRYKCDRSLTNHPRRYPFIFADGYNPAGTSEYIQLLRKLILSTSTNSILKIFNEDIIDLSTISFSEHIKKIVIENCNELESLNGMPDREFQRIDISKCPKLTTLDFISPAKRYNIRRCNNLTSAIFKKSSCGNGLMIYDCPNLKNLTTPKICKELVTDKIKLLRNAICKEARIYGDANVTNINRYIMKSQSLNMTSADITNILSILLIENLREFSWGWNNSKHHKAFMILSKYIGQGQSAILQCQRELIENNLEEYSYL